MSSKSRKIKYIKILSFSEILCVDLEAEGHSLFPKLNMYPTSFCINLNVSANLGKINPKNTIIT